MVTSIQTIAELSLKNMWEIFNVPSAEDAAQVFSQGTPFPHLVIDNFLPSPLIDEISNDVSSAPSHFSKVFKDDFFCR